MRTLADYKSYLLTCLEIEREYRKAARYARRRVEQIERKVLK